MTVYDAYRATVDNPPMPQTTAQRQADHRARRAMLGLTEVRGIYLPPEKHAELRRAAEKIKNRTVTNDPLLL